MSFQTQSIRSIVFDAYGTLFDVSSIDHFIQNEIGIEKTPVFTRIWRKKQLEYSWLRSLMGRYKDFYSITEDALRYTYETLQINFSEEVIRDCMRQYYHLTIYSDIRSTLEKLSPHYTLAVLSNANPSLLEKGLAYNVIDQWFKEIISADQVGIFKPSPKVYQLATQTLHVEAPQILFLSSNPWDIAGANSYGLTTCWINRNGSTMEHLDISPPSLSIKNVAEVLSLLQV